MKEKWGLPPYIPFFFIGLTVFNGAFVFLYPFLVSLTAIMLYGFNFTWHNHNYVLCEYYLGFESFDLFGAGGFQEL